LNDDGDVTEDDDGDATEDDLGAAPRARGRKQRGLDSLAMRQLRRAHKLFGEGGLSAAEANFLVSSASVLATLDLASAIRETQHVSDD
jgi:hypothetical protein